jgi:hypothetical protein
MVDHRGHPKKPLERVKLNLEQLVAGFLEATGEEDPALHKVLSELETGGRTELAGVLGRFDTKGQVGLSAPDRLLARRLVGRLQRPNDESLTLVNQILDYLDLNQDALIDERELDLAVEIFELFARAHSDNDTLSLIELEMLYAVLRHLDMNDNGKLDSNERARLREGLDDPAVFLEAQKATNPRLQAICERL